MCASNVGAHILGSKRTPRGHFPLMLIHGAYESIRLHSRVIWMAIRETRVIANRLDRSKSWHPSRKRTLLRRAQLAERLNGFASLGVGSSPGCSVCEFNPHHTGRREDTIGGRNLEDDRR